jgi:hypothetical protein
MRCALLLTLGILVGCNSPEAPSEVSDLMRFLMREFDNPDPDFLIAGAQNMADYLATVDYDAGGADRSTIPDPLREDDLVGMGHADGTDPLDTVNVSLAYRSSRPIREHALLQAEADHTIAEPSAGAYARTWDDALDPTCFGEQTCQLLRTTNIIERSNALFAAEFELFKHFRWTETEDGTPMIVARAWFDEIYAASRGSADLRQSYTLDVWMENADGGTDRVQVLYSDTAFDPPIDADIKRNTTRLSIDGAMSTTDEALAELFD